MSGVLIRRLQPEDANIFRTIRLRALEINPETFSSAYEEQVNHPLSFFESRIQCSSIFGAFSDDSNLVGIVAFHQETGQKSKHKGNILSLFVEPSGRRLGVGSALMEAALGEARKHVEHVLLGVSQKNESALRLYQRFGFVQYGVEPRAIKVEDAYIDEVLMVKRFELLP